MVEWVAVWVALTALAVALALLYGCFSGKGVEYAPSDDHSRPVTTSVTGTGNVTNVSNFDITIGERVLAAASLWLWLTRRGRTAALDRTIRELQSRRPVLDGPSAPGAEIEAMVECLRTKADWIEWWLNRRVRRITRPRAKR